MNIIQNQPKAFRLIALIQICESFSYYGMRAILILYLIKSFLLNDAKSYAINAIFITLVEFIRLIGGIIADKSLGLRYSIILGIILISVGHMTMSYSDFIYNNENIIFYLGLSFIILGSGLFKANCASLLGEFYKNNDPRKQAGYALYYSCINVGAFISTILCGFIAEIYGYKFGFGLAAIGMCIANIFLYILSYTLEDKGFISNFRLKNAVLVFLSYCLLLPLILKAISNAEIALLIMPFIMMISLLFIIYSFKKLKKCEIKNIGIIALSIILMAIFYSIELQMGSTLIIFADNFVELEIFNLKIPASIVNSINPLTIIFLGPIIARIIASKPYDIFRSFKNISIAYLIIGFSFTALSLACINISAYNKMPILTFLPIFAAIGCSELLVGPAIYALSSNLAPSNLKGSIMGLVMFGYSLAGTISGFLNKLFVFKNSNIDISLFLTNYSIIGMCLLLISLIIFIIINYLSKKESVNFA